MTGDLLPFMVFVLSHGFLGMSAENKTKQKLISSNLKQQICVWGPESAS